MKRLLSLLLLCALILCLLPAVVSAAEGQALSLTWSQGTYYDNAINPNLVSRKYTVIDVNEGDVVTFDYPTANWAIYVYYADANGSFGYVTSKQGSNETFVVQQINGRTPTQLRLTAFHRSGSNVTITDELWATFDVVISKTGMEPEPTSNIFTFATQNFGLWNDGVNQGVAADKVEERAAAWQAVMEKHGVDLLVGQEWLPYLDSDKTVSANEKVFGDEYPYLYGNSTSTYDGKNIVSRTPLSNISYTTMVSNVGRRYAKAYTTIGGKTVCIIDAHLSFEEDINVNRKEEMVELLNIAQTEKYAIIAGDFNVFTADEFEIFEEAGYSLANAGAFGEFNTWPNLGRNPTADVNRVIDNIIVSPGIRINNAWVEDTKLSDHALLAAELELLEDGAFEDNRLLCEHCGKFVNWIPVPYTNGGTANAVMQSGHYYLTQDLPKVNSQFYIGDTTYPTLDVVVDLRGHAVKSTGRVFYLRKNSKLTIVDTVGCGTLTGASASTGGTIYAENSCVLSIYDGSVYNTANPTTDRKGGTIYMETNAKLNLHGGEIYGGKASHGGALYAANTNIVDIRGGLISGGTATSAGGSVYVFAGTLTMTDGTITGGQGGSGGGLYLYKATANLNGGNIYGNSGTYGGNVHTADNGTTGCLNVGNVNVYGGTASGGGADYWVSSTGKACLVTKDATIRDNAGKNVTTTAGDMVLYVGGYYTVHDHNMVTDIAVAPTCTATGLTEGKHCTGCDTQTVAQSEIPALGHKYDEVKTEATFESDAFTTYTCSVCGNSYTETEEGTKLTAVATADGVPFETLEEALAAGGEIVLLADGEAAQVRTNINLNGFTLKADVYGKLTLNGGTLITPQGYKMIGPDAAYYISTDAVLTMDGPTGDITIHSGKLTLAQSWWTGAGQTLTIEAAASFEIPEGMSLNVLSTVIAKGQLTIAGTANLYTKDAVIYAPEGLNVTTTAGDKVVYAEGAYKAHSHVAGEKVTENETANSCTDDGSYDEVVYCSTCGDELSRETKPVPAAGHKYEDVKTEATFENDAFTTYTCSVCGDSYTETEEGTKLTAVATADGVPFQTLQEALTAGGNVVLLQDVADSDALEVKNTVVLDLNGKTVSMNDASGKAAQLIKNSGDLTIVDSVGNGKLTFHSTTPSASNSYSTSTIINVGALKILSGTIENTTTSGPSYAIDNAWYTTDVSLSIEGGTVTAVKPAIRQVPFSTTAKNTITISGGELSGYAGLQIHNYQKTACLSDVTITGGTFNGSYAFYTSYSYNNTATGTNIAIDGGEFNGYVYLYNGNTGSSEYPMTVSVTGGTFNTGYYAYCNDSTGAMVAIPSVTGGTHIYDVTDYCVEGYGMHANGDGTYGIHEHDYEGVKTEATFEADAFTTYTCSVCGDSYIVTEEGTRLIAVATADGIPFQTLQEALNAGGEVVLLDQITLTEKLVVETTATLNLSGYTLTLADLGYSYGLVVTGNLTILDEGTVEAPGGFGIGVNASGSLTIENGTFRAGQYNDYVIGNYGTTVINGGKFQGIYNCVNNFAGTTAIYGGTYTTEQFDWSGEYESADLFANAGLTVYGGTYSKPVAAEFCAENLCPKQNADGTYTVVEKAGFAQDPAAVTAEVGETVTFTVETVGDITAYRWEYSRDGINWFNTTMDGNTTATLTVPVLLSRNGYQYRCVISDAYGNGATSEAAMLTVNQPAGLVQITAQPQAQEAVTGAEAVFTVTATGDGLQYQWQYTKNGTNWYYTGMTGAKTAELIVVATAARDGYQYRCIITDAYGTQVISEAAALTVTEQTITTSGPADQVAENGKAVFTVEVEGEGLTYRWQYQRADGTKWFYTTMSGYSTNELTVTATKARNGYKYRCIITDAYGNETISEEAVLTVE